MKILIILMLISISLFAKTQAPPPGSYIANNNLDKFVGKWKWIDSAKNSEVVIILKKIAYHCGNSKLQFDEDLLIGCHSYKRNGIVIENNLFLSSTLGQNETGSILVFGNKEGLRPKVVTGIFNNLTKEKEENLELRYTNTNPPRLTWYLIEKPGWYLISEDGTFSDNSIILPHKIILVKQP